MTAQLSFDLDTPQGQSGAILRHLQGGGRITPREALERFRCFRLAARIHDLRKRGFAIRSQIIQTPSNKRVAEYWLDRHTGHSTGSAHSE